MQPMSDTSQGPGWWMASDGKWYAPELHPGYQAPQPPAAAPFAPAPFAMAQPAGQVGVSLPQGVRITSPWARIGSWLLDGILMAVTLYIGWLIWAALIGGTGQTPGKKLLGQRVIRSDSLVPASLGRMFWLRGILGALVVSFILGFVITWVLLFMPFWDRRNQNLWDKVSSTYVVNDPYDAWSTRPDLRNRA